MNEDNKDTSQVEKERITDSPNISVNSNDLDELQETISANSENPEATKPTAEQQTEMKFRSADISHPDGKNLMVNIEGSQKRKIEEAKQKKKDRQEAEKRKKTEEHKRKHDAQIIKRNKRINNLKTFAQKIWKLKFVFLGIILIITAIVLIVKVVIPLAGKIETETKKAAEEKIITEEKTTMIEIYKELTGKEFTKEELEEIVIHFLIGVFFIRLPLVGGHGIVRSQLIHVEVEVICSGNCLFDSPFNINSFLRFIHILFPLE